MLRQYELNFYWSNWSVFIISLLVIRKKEMVLAIVSVSIICCVSNVFSSFDPIVGKKMLKISMIFFHFVFLPVAL